MGRCATACANRAAPSPAASNNASASRVRQAARVSQQCAFFLAEHGTPGVIVEAGPTEKIFGSPSDERTSDYVHGRFG